jgi:hypothetical protein
MNQSRDVDIGECIYKAVGSEFDLTASSDNCYITDTTYELTGATVIAETAGASLGGIDFNAGTTTVTWRVYDAAANRASCSFTVLCEPTITNETDLNKSPYDTDHPFRNYPNPFQSSTRISYQLRACSHVEIGIYDIQGRKVAAVIDEKQIPGIYEVTWRADNIEPGIYFCKLKTLQGTEMINLILIK